MNRDQQIIGRFVWFVRNGGLGCFDSVEEFAQCWVQRGMRGLPRAPAGMSADQIVSAYRAA